MVFKKIIGVILLLGVLTPAKSAVISVNTLTETALANAIQTANATDTVYISGFGVINFTDSILIDKPLTITTDGLGSVTFDGGSASKFFHIVTSGDANVYLEKLRFNQGYSLNPGGAIKYMATSTGNFLRISNCTFSQNVSQQSGGALSINEQGALVLDSTTFSDNVGNNGGGAIAAFGDRNIDISNAYFYNNSTLSTGGGAIYVEGTSGLSIDKTTFYSNAAPISNGGALFVNSSSHSVVNSTFYFNGASNGGAIYTNDPFGNVSLVCCTVYSNSATNEGGGFYMNGGISLTHTVLASNTAGGADNDFTRDATNLPNLISNDYNFIGYDPGSEIFGPDPNDLIGTTAPIDPALGSIQDNGGYSSTLMPNPGSPLIDAGDLSAISFVTEDQVGNARDVNGTPDIGAVEYEVPCDILLVTRTDDAIGCGTLRSAIEYANQTPGSNIRFDNITEPIVLTSPLPPLTGNFTFFDGETNPTPVRIIGTGFPIGINVQADNIDLRGLSLEGFTDYGVYNNGSSGLDVEHCFIGINPDDNTSLTGPQYGVYVTDGDDFNMSSGFIGGSTFIANCSIAGVFVNNCSGYISQSVFGTDSLKSQAFPNQTGVIINNCNSNFYLNNVHASGNTIYGIEVNNSSNVNIFNTVVGMDGTKLLAIENGIGIRIFNSSDMIISGSSIAGNDDEGIFAEDSRDLTIVGNKIGVSANNGRLSNYGYSNWPGIFLDNSPNVTIGGTSEFDRNIISGNLNGIQVNNGSDSVLILGNYIGLDTTGSFEINGSGVGIGIVRSDYTRIGDGTLQGKNVIGGSIDAISFTRGYNFIVDGNTIGVDAAGTKKIPGYGGGGIRMSNFGTAESNDTIRNNTIAYQEGSTILVGTSADSVIITQNSIYGNDRGITFNTNNNSQQGVKPPRINSYNGSAYSGTAGPNAKIEVFADKADQGQLYLGSTTADASGDWTFTYDNSLVPLGLNYITAIQDSAGQSSQFSIPFERVDCSYLSAHIITEEFDAVSCEDTIVLVAEEPTIGTGYWDCLTVGGTIENQYESTVTIRDLPLNESEYKWVVSDGNCQVESYIEVYYDGYKRVNGGDDQVIGSDFATLNGVPFPDGESGGELPIRWSVLSGDADFENPFDPNTTITGMAPGLNVLLFTAIPESGLCPGLDTVEVYLDLEYAQPDAGEDQLVCFGEVTLEANYPGLLDESFGWTFYSGPNTPTIVDPLDPKTQVTGLVDGTYEFIWAIDDGDSNERDTVTIVSGTGPARPSSTSWLVNNTNDDGCGSLRNAVQESSPGDSIFFDPSLDGATIDLTTGEIMIDHTIFIIGNSPKIKLQNTVGSVFIVDMEDILHLEGIEFVESIDALKIRDAFRVTMDSVCFINNERAILDSSTARLSLNKTIFDNNQLFDNGAGIFKVMGGNLGIDSSKFYDNWSDNYSGAAIYARDTYVSIHYSHLEGNIASLQGGAVYLEGGYLDVYSSSFVDNTAFDAGGAVMLNNYDTDGAYGSIVNATFSGNFSDGYGAAIASDTSDLNIAFCTIVRNNTYGGAGGIYSSDENIFLKSTIVAENSAYGTPFDIECEGCLLRSFGNNLIGDTTGLSFQFSGSGDTLGDADTPVDPLLEDLIWYQDLFQIHTPMSISPVIDKGGYESSYTIDQIGNDRPFDAEINASDIGSIEYQKPVSGCPDSLFVTNTDDEGCGSLRAAVVYANNNTGTDTVIFHPNMQGQTITLQSTIDIEESIVIEGIPNTGGENIVLTSTNERIFDITTDQGDFTVSLSDLNFENTSSTSDGGAINFDYQGELYLKRCEFYDNSTDGYGGALFFSGNKFQADSCVFLGNSTTDNNEGGAGYVSVNNGNAYFNNCIIESNFAGTDLLEYSAGGGFSVSVSLGEIVFDKCLFNDNRAAEGGGLHTYGDAIDSVIVINTTFYENHAWGGGGAVYAGNSGEVYFINSTLAYNEAVGYLSTITEGGAVYGDATIYTVNSVFANNMGDPANIRAYAFEVESWGNNFIDDTSNTQGYDAFYSPLDLKGYSGNVLDPMLGPLQENGGYTNSMEPMAGSPLIDAGNDAYATTTDQNLNPRIFGNSIDIGSVELQEISTCVFPSLTYNIGDYVEICSPDAEEIWVLDTEGAGYEFSWFTIYEGGQQISDEDTLLVGGDDRVFAEVYDPNQDCSIMLDTIDVVDLYTELSPQDDFLVLNENDEEVFVPYFENDEITEELVSQVYFSDPQVDAPVFGDVFFPDQAIMLYTPFEDYYGNDTLRYEVEDYCGISGSAQVFISVLPTFPDFSDLSEEVIKGDSIGFTYTVPGNITDFGISDSLNEGKAKVTLDLTTMTLNVSYKQNPDFIGEDSMQFYLCKGTACDSTYLKLFIGELEGFTELEVFNGVSPNGDFLNEYLKIDRDPLHGQLSLVIVNKWGEVVYETRNYTENDKWDGTKNGKELPDGTYYYLLETNGEVKEKLEGYILLKR